MVDALLPRAALEACVLRVREQIDRSAGRSGRDPDAIRLVAVTKGQPAPRIREAHALGIGDLGENRTEDGLAKRESLKDLAGLRWHMIGRIQSRKAAGVVKGFDLVHSLDRLDLAGHLERRAADAGRILPVLLQCNLAREESKAGWTVPEPQERPGFWREWEEIAAFPHLEIRGLMTLAPWHAAEPQLREIFGGLRALLQTAKERIPGTWRDLSMGMSDDFEVAIEEGATLVRIGRALFEPDSV